MAIRDEVLKELLEGYKKPEDLLGPEGLVKKLTAALVIVGKLTTGPAISGYGRDSTAGGCGVDASARGSRPRLRPEGERGRRGTPGRVESSQACREDTSRE